MTPHKYRKQRSASDVAVRFCVGMFTSLVSVQVILTLLEGAVLEKDTYTKAGGGSLYKSLRRSLLYSSAYNVSGREVTSSRDDFFARPHIVPSNAEDDRQQLPVLIIGGSDGSGTRAFASIVSRLGVPVVVDDSVSLDVHAQCLYNGAGWPRLVDLIINETHSANFAFDDLGPPIQTEALAELERFQTKYGARAGRLMAHLGRRHMANAVQYGFKAPVAMLLLPLLHRAFGRIKFIHVVRDGRDVALSANKSPVDKFYDTFFTDAASRRTGLLRGLGDNETARHVMAMQLWDVWNRQVLDYGKIKSDGVSFDYLVMRTEDLLDPSTRFEAIVQLAEFVGSPHTTDDLCCLSQMELNDMGESRSAPPSNSDHKNRPDVRRQLGHLFHDGIRDPPEAMTSATHTAHRGDWSLLRNHVTSHVQGDEGMVQNPTDVYQLQENRNDIPNKLNSFAKTIQRSPNDIHKVDLPQGGNPADDIMELLRRLHKESAGRRQQLEMMVQAYEERTGYDSLLETDLMDRIRSQRAMEALHIIPDGNRRNHIRNSLLLRHPPPQVERGTADDVKHRYGKWATKLQNQPQLSSYLHENGAIGLKVFGYEPSVPFLDIRVPPLFCATCTTS